MIDTIIECLHCTNDAVHESRYCARCLHLNPPCAVVACPANAAKLRHLCAAHQAEFLAEGIGGIVYWLATRTKT